MLDINFIRANRELVQHSITEKMYKNVDLDKLLALDDTRKATLQQVENLRKERNQNTDSMKGSKPTEEQIARGKELKEQLAELEAKLEVEDKEFRDLLKTVPNIIFEDVPLGDESASVEVKTWGGQKAEGVDHLDYAISRDWVDFERGAKVAGAKFYYVKGGLALLENALVQFGIKKVTEHGFTLMDVPDMVNSRVLEGTGFAPRSSEQSDEYYIEGEDLAMIATAEMPITGYHMDEIIDEDKLPLFYAGFSACFRKEAGASGKHTRGLFRVHQFNKLEMYSFCLPEQSKEIHEKIRAIEEEIWQEIGIPYHVINIAAGEPAVLTVPTSRLRVSISASAAKMVLSKPYIPLMAPQSHSLAPWLQLLKTLQKKMVSSRFLPSYNHTSAFPNFKVIYYLYRYVKIGLRRIYDRKN